jgi:hypothetical protein
MPEGGVLCAVQTLEAAIAVINSHRFKSVNLTGFGSGN